MEEFLEAENVKKITQYFETKCMTIGSTVSDTLVQVELLCKSSIDSEQLEEPANEESQQEGQAAVLKKGLSFISQILEYSFKKPVNLSCNIFLFSAMHKQSHHKNQQDYVRLGKGVFKLGQLEFLLLKLSVHVLVQIDFPTSQNYYYYFFCNTVRHGGSWFPHQGLNPCSLQWKCGVLTT